MRDLTNYNPPKAGPFKDNPAEAAKVFDTLVYTMGEERLAYALEMRKAGWQGELWMYMLQHGIRDTERQAEQKVGTPAYTDKGTPWRNNFAYKGSKDIVRLRDNEGGHPFLLTPDGRIVRKDNPPDFVVADSSHPAWRKLVQERIREQSSEVGAHYAGLWLDDLNIHLYLNQVGLTETKQYGDPKSEAYFDALMSYLEFCRSEAGKVGWRFGGNLQGEYGDRWRRAANALIQQDGGNGPGVVMIEFAWIKHNGEWPSEWEWKQTFDKATHVVANGGELWLVIPVNGEQAASDEDERAKAYFGYVSSMLVADERTAVRIGGDYGYQGNFDFFNEADTLGKPEDLIKLEGDVYKRDYEHGTVWVNPKARTCGIEMMPVAEVPAPPEPAEEPVTPVETPPVQTPVVEPELAADELPTIYSTIFMRGQYGGKNFDVVIGFDPQALLPIFAAIASSMKNTDVEVARH